MKTYSPHQIVSDTIVPDDCGVIVGVEEPGSVEAGKQGGMEAGGHGGVAESGEGNFKF